MEPEPLPRPDPAPSLADRLSAAARAVSMKTDGSARTIGWMLALMLPLGPLATWVGAAWLADRTEATIRAEAASPAALSADRAAAERRMLARLAGGGFAPVIERVAGALPADARLVAVEVARDGEGGLLTAEVATAEPDRLRAALARSALRTTGERQGDGVLIVRIEGAP